VSLPLITDWFFYAVSIPAVILLGISKSSFGAGFGSLAVPMMALAITVPDAAAILMPILFIMDVMGLAVFRKQFDRSQLKLLIPAGLLGTAIGTLLFKALDAQMVAGIVGVCTLLFLAQRLLFPPHAASRPPPRWLGGVLGTVSGFTSFVAHSGGPPLNAYMIPLRMQPITFAATASIFFFVMNLAKWVPYAWLGLLDVRNMSTSLALIPFAPLGVFIGVRLSKNLNPKVFYRLVLAGMLLTGLKLVYDGFF
jgi:hypothetical protein